MKRSVAVLGVVLLGVFVACGESVRTKESGAEHQSTGGLPGDGGDNPGGDTASGGSTDGTGGRAQGGTAGSTTSGGSGGSGSMGGGPGTGGTGARAGSGGTGARAGSGGRGGQAGGSTVCPPGWGDCTAEPGCETNITLPSDCGACGRDCGVAHATPECSSPLMCAAPACDRGFGDCDEDAPGCESTYGASCFPKYDWARLLAVGPVEAAIASDGSVYTAGTFGHEVDFDTSDGVDRQAPVGYPDAFVTRFEPNGAYAWTRALSSDGSVFVSSIAVTPAGNVVVVGYFTGTIDLDPGPGTDAHTSTVNDQSYAVELSSTGTLVWGRVFAAGVALNGVAVDAAGSTVVCGAHEARVDLDPGAGEDIDEEGNYSTGFLLKLDAAGDFVWSRRLEGDITRLWSVGIASDSSIWSTGQKFGNAAFIGHSLGTADATFVVGANRDGEPLGAWAYDDDDPQLMEIAAGNGRVYSRGSLEVTDEGSEVDVAPGSALDRRVFDTTRSYSVVIAFDTQGTYRDAHVDAHSYALAVQPDGGLLVALPGGDVRAYGADGKARWTVLVGSGDGDPLLHLAASPTHFVAVGSEPAPADFDPGPGEDLVGPGPVLARYSFP